MSLASAAAATTTTALPFKNSPLTLLRRHVHPYNPHLFSPPYTTSALLSGRRAWATGDGDGGVHRWSPAAPKKSPRHSYEFRRTAVSLAGDGGGPIVQDAVATVVVMGGAYALVLAFDVLTQRKFIEQNLSRKLVHILSGLLFMACWPIFRVALQQRLAILLLWFLLLIA